MANLVADWDEQEASRVERIALLQSRELVIPLVAAEGLRGLAAVAVTHGDLPRAARLVGAAATHTYERIDGKAFFEPARRRQGEAAWDAASREGATLSLPEALAYALQDPGSPGLTTHG